MARITGSSSAIATRCSRRFADSCSSPDGVYFRVRAPRLDARAFPRRRLGDSRDLRVGEAEQSSRVAKIDVSATPARAFAMHDPDRADCP